MNRWTRGVWAGVAAVPLVAGCSTTRQPSCGPDGKPCPEVVPGAIPEPNGAFVRRFTDRQAAKAEASEFAVYWNEFNPKGDGFGPAGQRHMDEIALRLPQEPFGVLVQSTGKPETDAKHRSLVVATLTAKGVTDAEQRVAVGHPQAEPLRGDEAPRVFNGLLRGGTLGGGAGGSGLGGGLGGGGLGGGFGGGGLGGGGLGGGFR